MESVGLERAVAFASENGQLAIWDRCERQWAIALYDQESRQLSPLSDEQSALLLNRDALIRREWRRWNAMTGNVGSLIILDAERARCSLNGGDPSAGI